MDSKTPTCSTCWRSIFRTLHGVTVLYCGYYYRVAPSDGMACNNHTKANPKK